METLYKVLSALALGFMAYMTYRRIKADPQMLSKENFSKSSTTMAILALALIAFIWFLVMMLRNS